MITITAKKALATLATAAMATAALVVVAQPALADDPMRLATLHASPASGQIDVVTTSGWLEEVWSETGQVCPTGHRARSQVYASIDGVLDDSTPIAGMIRSGVKQIGQSGGIEDDEDHIFRSGEFIATDMVTFPWLDVVDAGGLVEIRHTCQTATVYNPATDPYYGVDILVQPGGAWAVVASGPTAADTSESDINVDIPTLTVPPVPTGLTISVKPGPTTLTGPTTREAGTAWQATGTLPNTTVNDDRQDATADDWTLTGRASAFTQPAGVGTIASTNLGWAPAKVSGQGAVGATVAPNTNGGLSTDKQLASGQASGTANVTTTVNALFTLEVPEAAPAGAYKSTLTLTLI
ncbi:MAG: hypothetical protein LBS27_00320 [Bifidobacteriaceae bacterium]|nr:hypothetical protein [Bifidobacteriaceae bacterium]